MGGDKLFMSDIIYDVDLASDVKDFIVSNDDDVSFSDSTLKSKIMSMDNDKLIRLGKIINSPTKIVSVDIVDSAFFRANLYREDGDKN